MSSGLPTGTVTFLFTDIEGSTKRWEHHPQQMSAALARHDLLLRQAIEAEGGYVFKTVGDAFCAAFSTPHHALQAALQAQIALNNEEWGEVTGAVRVRMALHTGVAEERNGDYFGQPVNRVARILTTGHGGQTLLSNATYDLVRDALPPGVRRLDLGAHRLKDLIRPENLFQLVIPGLPAQFPPLSTLDTSANNLPRQATPLIGRESEIERICSLLRGQHTTMVTLTGPGGTGKTRLGLQGAADMLDDFVDGVWFVDLSPVLDMGLVISTIAQTLGVRESPGESLLDTLTNYLKEKQLLLVLDNFEHIVGAAPQVGGLLMACARLKMLVTSRVPLRIRGEKEYPVSPLSLPDYHNLPSLARLTQYEAVRLFIERATDIKPDFEVNNDNAPALAEICVRLDGLPLAIELAAARIRLFPPQALLPRLSNRLKMLTGGAANLPVRQQTLFNTMEWSYDLLSKGEQQFFRRMAVFQGGRTLEALEAVCNSEGLQVAGHLEVDVLERVEGLIQGNLLQQREGAGGEARFWMLETIHEYARQKLQESGEADSLQREHALYFMRFAEEAEPHLTGSAQVEWLNRLQDEYDNIREALRWAKEKGSADGEALETGLKIAGAIWRFWLTRGYYHEAREQLDGLLSLAGSVGVENSYHKHTIFYNKSNVKVLNAASAIAKVQWDYSAARSLGEQALAIANELDDKPGMALAFNLLGNVAGDEEDHPRARALYEQSLAIRRELGDKRGIAALLNNLGGMAREEGDYQAARSLHEQSLAIQKELGDKIGMSGSFLALGGMVYEEGDYQIARSLFEQSLATNRELGDKPGIAFSLSWLGNIAWREGDHATARSSYEQGANIYKELGDKWRIAYWFYRQGLWAYEEGGYHVAHSLFKQSFSIWKEMGQKGGIAIAMGLTGMGGAVAKLGRAHRGMKLLGAAEAIYTAVGEVRELDDRVPYEGGIASARSRLGEEEFEKAWQEGQAMTIEQAIAYALEDTADA